MKNKAHAIVIGAGIAGIASAIRLAAKGYAVTVYEAAGEAGGKLSEIRIGGFRFDRGPSLFTLPHLVDELFTLAGKNPSLHFPYKKLDEVCRYHWPDGTKIHASADPQKFSASLSAITSDHQDRILQYLSGSKKLYESVSGVFLERSLHKTSTWLSKSAGKSLLNLHRLKAHQSMAQENSRFFQDAKTQQLFNRFATYNGSDPWQAPATLNVIPHLEHNLGAFFPDGGMYSIVNALQQLAEDLGVEFRFHEQVDEILLKDGRATGIRSGENTDYSDLVISNMDAWFTYRKLLPEQKAPEKQLRQEKSSSALIFYWGMQGAHPEVGLHNIFFSGDYRDEFRKLFQEKSLTDDPTVYVYNSSTVNGADAPAGCSNWFVMINAPHVAGQDWDSLRSLARKAILEKLDRMLGKSVEDQIISETFWDPPGIEAETFSHLGALYGPASNNKFAAFLRHPNFSRRLKGLYFVGGSVHPGGGIPLCLLSAKIMAREIPALK